MTPKTDFKDEIEIETFAKSSQNELEPKNSLKSLLRMIAGGAIAIALLGALGCIGEAFGESAHLNVIKLKFEPETLVEAEIERKLPTACKTTKPKCTYTKANPLICCTDGFYKNKCRVSCPDKEMTVN